nr:putative ribonuclease H-like domain-containing protein [Tanacetum cinerariifolium]
CVYTITEIENLVDKKVKVIRCDNGTEFKNSVTNDFCAMKGIKREFSVARTPQQNDVAERRNRTPIEAARTIKAFKVYNIRTKRVEENMHIEFLENKPIDGSLIDSSSKNPTIDEPQSFCHAENKDDNGVNKDSGIDAYEKSAKSINDVNTVGPSINTARTDFDTDMLNINTVSPIVSTASPEATHADFFGDQPEGDMSNINTTYQVPSTLNIRIHKDHSLDLVIGDVQFGVLIRKMT